MKIEAVEQFLIENPNPEAFTIFGHFKLDLESILITFILLNIYDPELKKQFDLINDSDERTTYLVDEYLHDNKFSHTLIPHNLFSALYIFTKNDHIDFANNIISSLILKSNYINSIRSNNIFEKEIIFFTFKVNFQDPNFIELIKESFFNKQATFIDPSYQDLFYFLRLPEFSKFDDSNIEIIKNKIEDIKSELIYPTVISLDAKLLNDIVLISIDARNLEESVTTGKVNSTDFKKIAKDFFHNFFTDIADDFVDMGLKYLATQKFELLAVDFGVKTVKHLIITISKQNEENLSSFRIQTDYQLFKSSGEDSMKNWYISDLKTKIEEIASKMNNISLNLPNSFYENHYQKFYSKYLFFYLNHPNSPGIDPNISFQENDVYERVLDLVNEQTINIKKNKRV